MVINKFIAHRGANQIAPENTMMAFEKAYQAGCDWIELDVQLSKDGVLFIFHDNNAAKLTGLDIDPTEYNYTQLRELKILTEKYPNEAQQGLNYIPTMQEYLDWMKLAPHLHTNIEIKVKRIFDEAYEIRLVEALLNLLSEYPDLQQKLLLSSSSEYIIASLAKNNSTINRALVLYIEDWETVENSVLTSIKSKYVQWGCIALGINNTVLTPKIIQCLKENFGQILTYSRGDDEILKLLNNGVDSVFIDDLSFKLKTLAV